MLLPLILYLWKMKKILSAHMHDFLRFVLPTNLYTNIDLAIRTRVRRTGKSHPLIPLPTHTHTRDPFVGGVHGFSANQTYKVAIRF